MFGYYLRLGILSIKANPALSALMVAAIGIGIGACMSIVTIQYIMSGNPIPEKSDQLHFVRVDSWDPNEAYDDPNEPPEQLTYLDATALYEAGRATRQVISFKSMRVVEPAGEDSKPFQLETRATTTEFFAMFNVPFKYGAAWDNSADASIERVVVINESLNEQLFGGQDSVGEMLTLTGESYRVVGVLDYWEPTPRFYDPIESGFEEVNDMIIPFQLTRVLELKSAGSDWGWKSEDINSFDQWLGSEALWIQYFIELDSVNDREEYVEHLDAYVGEQKTLGRYERPLNNHIYDVKEWMEYNRVVARDSRVLLGLSFLFLLVCVLSTIALTLTKFIGKKAETSLRRALGASRKAIFRQQLVEVGLIGFTGGLIGLGLVALGLEGIKTLYEATSGMVRLDWVMMLTAVGVAISSSVIAGLYPAWRVCNIPPATQLKTQ